MFSLRTPLFILLFGLACSKASEPGSPDGGNGPQTCENPADCVELCDNGFDDDGDSRVDCVDPDCDGKNSCELNRELTCNDGINNDGDAVMDCADPDCDGVSGCEFGQERSCSDGIDNDLDGTTDCKDPNCDGIDGCQSTEKSCGDGIDNDVDELIDCDDDDCASSGVCLVSTCPMGSELMAGQATGMPIAIADNATVTSTIDIATDGRIVQVSSVVSVNHPFPGDLDLSLIGPGGQRFEMSTDNGGGEDNAYIGTVFSDVGPISITEATPPFTNAYRPEQAFTPLLGESPLGTWTLEVTDDTPPDTGSLEAFSIVLCACAAPCAPEASCSDGTDEDGDGVADCLDPGCDGVDTCEYASETSCGDGNDNDGDGDADCEDSDCVGQTQCILACPAGSSLSTFTATDTPVVITDLATVTSTIAVAATGTVTKAAVEISLTHTFISDLDITLISPAATRAILSQDNGGGEDAYTNTLFSDTAAIPIGQGTAPFTGAFKPEQPLSAVAGGASNGNWVLEVVDDAGSDTGTLTDYVLHLCIE